MASESAYPVLLLKTAWGHPSPASDVLGGLATVGGALVFLLERFGIIASEGGGVVAGWVAVSGLAVVALVRVLLAPYWIHKETSEATKRLESKLSEYEVGPKLLVSARAPTFSADGAVKQTLLVLPLRVTNEGLPGSAFSWRVRLRLSRDRQIDFEPLEIEEASFTGVFEAQIPRGETIWERTARRIDRGESVFGYYVGVYHGEDIVPEITEQSLLTVVWADQRNRLFGVEGPLGPRNSGPFQLLPPTLSGVRATPTPPTKDSV